jgi:hypothetical protein
MEQMARMQQNQGQGGAPGAPGASGGYAEQMARMQGGGNQQAAQMAQMQQSMKSMAAGYGGARPGGQGGPAGPGAMGPGGMAGMGMGGRGGDNGPANTHTAEGAVRAFLKALEAKDRDALAEATAARAASDSPLETTSTHKELFGKILDGSIADAELDTLATQLKDFKVAGVNAVKSTARLGVYADKPNGKGGTYRRTFTVRKEKKGWGVMDISREIEFKGMGNMNQRRR